MYRIIIDINGEVSFLSRIRSYKKTIDDSFEHRLVLSDIYYRKFNSQVNAEEVINLIKEIEPSAVVIIDEYLEYT